MTRRTNFAQGRRQDKRKFFDSAGLGLVPTEIIAEATKPLDRPWDELIEEARHSFGRLLAPRDDSYYSYDPNKYITLFMNATSALGRILSVIEKDLAGSNPTLLTTDLEFPGCVAAIDDSWSGPVVMARIGLALAGQPNPDRLLHDELVRAYNYAKPRVVFLSHVARTTGQVISPATLRYFREANPRVIVVLDGSQAVGNVVVADDILREVDFYVASGHKWLGGLTTSGFVWQREPGRWKIADPGQSFAQDRQLGGSGNAPAWVSLIMSVDEMAAGSPMRQLKEIMEGNRDLGELFCRELSSFYPEADVVTPCIEARPPTGLVTVGFPIMCSASVEALPKGYRFTILDYERVWWTSPTRNRFLLECKPIFPAISSTDETTATRLSRARIEARFCFHHWHTEEDIYALVSALSTQIKPHRPRAKV